MYIWGYNIFGVQNSGLETLFVQIVTLNSHLIALPANPLDFILWSFSLLVLFVLYYFDVALLMSCEISCAEHSKSLAHSYTWQLWERATAELWFAIWMVSFSEALQGQGDCKSLLGVF